MARPIGSVAEWGGGLQNGGAVIITGGSVGFKGGSIARSKAVRDPLPVADSFLLLHKYIA